MKIVIQKRADLSSLRSYKWEARGYRNDGSQWFVVAYKTKKEAIETNRSFVERDNAELVIA